MTIPTVDTAEVRRDQKVILSGIVASISNPYWLIWWITLGSIYLLWSLSLGMAGVASFFTGHILADLGWYALVAFVVATGRRVMNAVVYRWLLVLCGLALLVLGGYFVASAVRFWTS